MKIRVNKAAIFCNKNNDLVIKDRRGVNFLVPTTSEFTLPKTALDYYIINKPVEKIGLWDFKKSSLPPYERDLKHDFSKFSVVFGNNPNKCTIKHKQKLIFFDNQFKKSPWPVIIFIIMHEIGHNWYETEHFADEFAVNNMLKKGYMPEQIIDASNILSAKNVDRKRNILAQIYKRT